LICENFQIYGEHAEMKITAIRALGKLGGDGAEEIVRDCFADPDWRVRAVAAGSAFLCNSDVLPLLRKLLYDPVYFVRINASKSIARFGESGLLALEAEADSQDKFVRDTVRFILEDKVRYA
jgi:HEAT repeat protein